MNALNSRDKLARAILDHFQARGEWPLLAHLQRAFTSEGSVERIAAEEAHGIIICGDAHSMEAVCTLTLRGFDMYAPGSREVELFLATARHAAKRFLEEEAPPQIDSAEIEKLFRIDPLMVRKLGRLIRTWSGFLSSASGPSADSEFTFTPSKDAWYYETVQNVDDYLAARARIEEDRQYVMHKRGAEYSVPVASRVMSVRESVAVYATGTEAGFSITVERLNLVRNPSLRSLLWADATEINRLFLQGSWKSVGFLAGSCCEGLLIDLLEQEEPRTTERLGLEWRYNKGLSHLISAGHSFGLLSELTVDLSKFLKRWRDLIHPWKASTTPPPTREVALSIIALLEWLLAEIQGTRPQQSHTDGSTQSTH